MQRSIVLVLRTRISNVTAVHSRAHALSKRLEFRASVCPKWGGRVRTVISLPPKPPSPAQPHPADVPPKNTTLAPPTSSSSPRKAMFDATQTFDAAMEDWISLSAELEAAKRVELAARTALCNSEEVLSQVQHLLYSENASLTGVAEMLDDAQLSYDRFVAEAAVALGFQTGQVYELAAALIQRVW
ncbi:hypothetical protein BKA62DRAFT_721081 [Auriculariales sp. MPI-PUGE-AT-0066]|nr:hypothetical protein BKA62DRAFT_721081 [Auriculariales sp. MPI-PUGE-AT-0066]